MRWGEGGECEYIWGRCVGFGIRLGKCGSSVLVHGGAYLFSNLFQHGVWRMLHSGCMVKVIHVYCPVAGIG